MEKIKLSSYAKKVGKSPQEQRSFHHSPQEDNQITENKIVKYIFIYSDKQRKAQSRWKRYKNSEKTLLKQKQLLKQIIWMNSFAFSAKIKKKYFSFNPEFPNVQIRKFAK